LGLFESIINYRSSYFSINFFKKCVDEIPK
jgi:hypothetical protein